jgi:hypothetical protein
MSSRSGADFARARSQPRYGARQAPQNRLEKYRVGRLDPGSLQQGSDLVLRGRRIGALQNLGALCLDFVGPGTVHAPALCPGRQQQRFGSIGKAIAGKNERSAGLQP